MHKLVLIFGSLAFAVPASADVVQDSSEGFVSHHIFQMAPPDVVWEVLTEPSVFWNPEHTYLGEAEGLVLDPRPGGCFCEYALGEDGEINREGAGIEHARVLAVVPGTMLRLSGALGPLQSEALDGTLTIEISQTREGSDVLWTYVVGGYARFDLEQIAPAVDMVMGEQLMRLKAAVEERVAQGD